MLYANDDTCADDLAVDQLNGGPGADAGYGVLQHDVFGADVESVNPCP